VKVFKQLSPKDKYQLTKIKSLRASMVGVGESVKGSFTTLERDDYAVMVLVDNSARDRPGFSDPTYIRTSPVVAILDSSTTGVTFQTEGGVYQLEKLKEDKA
jgi:hypothetical protein